MKFKANVTAPNWYAPSTWYGLPRSVKGIGTSEVTGDDFIRIEDIFQKVPIVDGLGRELQDGDELSIVESTTGIINVYCPKFADGLILEVPDIVIDFDGTYEVVDNERVIIGEPVFGTVYIKDFSRNYTQEQHPTTNEPGINFDGGYGNLTLDAVNRRAPSYDSRALYGLTAAHSWSTSYGYEVPDQSIFKRIFPDPVYATVRKEFYFTDIYTRSAPTIRFTQVDDE